LFKEPYVDIDEWRDKPVRDRYVHGGFKGIEARFSFYFPPRDRYQGRFFQHITPIPLSEHMAQGRSGEDDDIGFAVASGGYFVETNCSGSWSKSASRSGDDDPADPAAPLLPPLRIDYGPLAGRIEHPAQ
jgi:hypothetical protein